MVNYMYTSDITKLFEGLAGSVRKSSKSQAWLKWNFIPDIGPVLSSDIYVSVFWGRLPWKLLPHWGFWTRIICVSEVVVWWPLQAC